MQHALPRAALAAAALTLLASAARAGDPDQLIRYEYGPNMRFGVSVIRNLAGKSLDKKLTFSANGDTNDTKLRVDGKELEFGGKKGRWTEQKTSLPPVGNAGEATRSVWVSGDIQVTLRIRYARSHRGRQVEVSPGNLKWPLDNIHVAYIIENVGARKHKVGLRVLLDTLIGENDGVPFTVPGQTGLVDTSGDYSGEDVPPFIEALERPDLAKPGTIGHLVLRRHDSEAPSRVSLTHWTGSPPYEVPVADLNGDSAVAIYWADQEINAGERRVLGFNYGLGYLHTQKDSTLGVTVSGAFEQNTEFTVTAYVPNPKKGQTVELTLPSGLELVRGNARATVPMPSKGQKISTVFWRGRAVSTGQYTISVRTAGGPTLTRVITITPRQKGSTGAAPAPYQPRAGLLPEILPSLVRDDAPATGILARRE